MHLEELTVKNFRNYDYAKVDFSKNLNVLTGKNAQGKTNLLEAVYICAIGKSPRTNKLKECIKWGKTFSTINLKIHKRTGSINIDFRILENGKKVVLINDTPIKSLAQLLGELNLIYFFPDDLKLIKEAPLDRRKFMDIDISQASKMYFTNLTKYNITLAQRNKLLKTSNNLNEVKATIRIWNEQLSTYASNIILSRIRFLKKLAPLVNDCHKYLSGTDENLEISYQGEIGETTAEIKTSLLKKYEQTLEKDFSLGHTSIGPHKDDIKIELNDIDLRDFGSQGQQRTASLALKFAEIELFNQEKGEQPILLLDDVLSELDKSRRGKLIELSNTLQTILTCTEYEENAKNNKIFYINQGQISKK